jgi:hypothetical protein
MLFVYGSCENFLQAKFCFLHALPERRPNFLSKSSKRFSTNLVLPASSKRFSKVVQTTFALNDSWERLGNAGTNLSKKTFWKKKKLLLDDVSGSEMNG